CPPAPNEELISVGVSSEGISVPTHSCVLAALSPQLSERLSGAQPSPLGQRRKVRLDSMTTADEALGRPGQSHPPLTVPSSPSGAPRGGHSSGVCGTGSHDDDLESQIAQEHGCRQEDRTTLGTGPSETAEQEGTALGEREEDRAGGEEDRAGGEEDRAGGEQDRAIREEDRAGGEQDRAGGEQDRAIREEDRAIGEEDRAGGEQDRAIREEDRAGGEQDRAGGEQDRAGGEQDRAIREEDRAGGEEDRTLVRRSPPRGPVSRSPTCRNRYRFLFLKSFVMCGERPPFPGQRNTVASIVYYKLISSTFPGRLHTRGQRSTRVR
uniref:BTB domain-containing protein n=1 Tax=Takifugu rubripes TaxID=31033 RepID=A0A674PNV4_TAKRU